MRINTHKTHTHKHTYTHSVVKHCNCYAEVSKNLEHDPDFHSASQSDGERDGARGRDIESQRGSERCKEREIDMRKRGRKRNKEKLRNRGREG